MITFGPFVLIPSQQLLLKTDQLVQIGTRAFEILTCLVERAGEVVSKEDLIARVWPNVFVQEGNLKVHVAALRQALDIHAAVFQARVVSLVSVFGKGCPASDQLEAFFVCLFSCHLQMRVAARCVTRSDFDLSQRQHRFQFLHR
jgi:hypothetical protein